MIKDIILGDYQKHCFFKLMTHFLVNINKEFLKKVKSDEKINKRIFLYVFKILLILTRQYSGDLAAISRFFNGQMACRPNPGRRQTCPVQLRQSSR